MRSALLLFLAIASVRASASPAGEPEAYTNVARTRTVAARANTPETRSAMEKAARAYLARHGNAPRATTVRVWLGDCLAPDRPRDAYRLYRMANTPAGKQRAAQLVLLHERTPTLDVQAWIGTPLKRGPPGGPDGAGSPVTLVVFVSLTHPQTARLLPHLVRLHKKHERRLRIALVAAVVDDHASQRPEALARRLRALRLPFPAAVDRQRRANRSVSLTRYRGRSLPWAAVLDGYGRVAWAGPARLTSGALSRFEKRLTQWTRQPTYKELVRRATGGDGDALATLAGIRAKPTIDALLSILLSNAPDKIRKRARRALLGLGPAHLAYDAEAKQRWTRDKQSYAYDLAKDRVVRK